MKHVRLTAIDADTGVILHEGVCRLCLQTFLFFFVNKRSSFHNCLFLILSWFLVLYSLYLNFV